MKAPAIKIEKGVPLPPRRTALNWPFWDMVRGDSFFVACEDDSLVVKRTVARIATPARKFGKANKCKFVARPVREDGKVGVRCWRVE